MLTSRSSEKWAGMVDPLIERLDHVRSTPLGYSAIQRC